MDNPFLSHNINEICAICLNVYGCGGSSSLLTMIPVKEPIETYKALELISKFKYSADGPQYLCSNCFFKTTFLYDFQLICNKAQCFYEDYLEYQNPVPMKIEPMELNDTNCTFRQNIAEHEEIDNQNSDPLNSDTELPMSGRSQPKDNDMKWMQSVTDTLEKLVVGQDQQTTLLAQIGQAIQRNNIQMLEAPPEIPNLPLEHRNDFKEFEVWLQDTQNYNYMRARLSSIGGGNLRAATMNCMKYMLTNQVAMQFSWAGTAPKFEEQETKESFKTSSICKVIIEAIKVYMSANSDQVDDHAISRAIQDWLKQAKHRYSNGLKKQEAKD